MQKVYKSADYITINISSPNTPGLRNFQKKENLNKLLTKINLQRNILKKEYKKSLPILLKIDPDINDRLLKDLVDITIRKKLNGIIATNTTIDKSVIKKSLQNIPDGGISGKLLYKKSNKTLKKVNKFSKGKLQVIGLGGVDNGDSAYQKIKLGASGIQLYSGLIFKGPDVIEDILSNLLIILQKAKKMSPLKNLEVLANFREVANKYEAFIIDIWGVLWDGIEPYQYSIESLKKLINLNKYIILLSNAPRRSKVVSKRLEDIGIDSSYYHKIISSGEICRLKFLKNKELLNKFGYTYYFIGQEQDQTITELLKLTETDNIKKADFVLVCGTRRFEDTLNDYIKELDLAFSYNLPLICANPDKVVIRKTGELLVCAGSMAKYYKKKGGLVFQVWQTFYRDL